MKIIGIIPARMASTRFPGKPLKKILGIPMIGHVYQRCKLSKVLDQVYVATCDSEIYDYIESIRGKAIMTANTHERAADRTAEALTNIEKLNEMKLILLLISTATFTSFGSIHSFCDSIFFIRFDTITF